MKIGSKSYKCFSKAQAILTFGRILRYLYDNYELPYNTFLAKSGKVRTKASRLMSICVETYQSINSIDPSFINEIFRLGVTIRAVRTQYRLNLETPKVNQVSFS